MITVIAIIVGIACTAVVATCAIVLGLAAKMERKYPHLNDYKDEWNEIKKDENE